MKHILVFIFISTLFACTSNSQLIWSDEFETAGSPDPEKWTYDLGDGCPNVCGWGNNERQTYTNSAQNVRVEGGNLVIEALQLSAADSTYSSARIKSKGKGYWQGGYIEVRAQLPLGRGTWPAIWMLPENNKYGGWPRSGEIDIMEHVGYDQNVIHGTIHTEAYNHRKGTQIGQQKNIPGASEEFHTYSINWTDNKIEWFIDGKKYHTVKNDGSGYAGWPFDEPFHLIMNVAVGGNWGGKYGIDKTVWPQKMLIDYVRVYDHKP